MTYAKRVLTSDGHDSESIFESKNIEILPGSSQKTPICFEGQGNQEPGYPPSRLVFDLVAVNEKNMRRDGDNIIYTANISLMQALDSESITVVLIFLNLD